MTLNTNTLDCAIEWLLPQIGTKDITIINDENGERIDVVSALCVWCLRLRFNLIEHNVNGINSNSYPAWNGYRIIASSGVYRAVQNMAKAYRAKGGVAPDYTGRDHKDISKWTYKRVFGPENFVPIHITVEELWRAVQQAFPDMVAARNKEDIPLISTDRIDSDFLEFEIYNKELANILEEL